MFSGLIPKKRNTEYAKNYRNTKRNQPFSFVIYSSPSPVIPQRSLWFFLGVSVLKSESIIQRTQRITAPRAFPSGSIGRDPVKLGAGLQGLAHVTHKRSRVNGFLQNNAKLAVDRDVHGASGIARHIENLIRGWLAAIWPASSRPVNRADDVC